MIYARRSILRRSPGARAPTFLLHRFLALACFQGGSLAVSSAHEEGPRWRIQRSPDGLVARRDPAYKPPRAAPIV
ncbi:hypothetical protein GCM10007036_16230 [Alsobacter metallidurans]|uniref:Uncharacterized protein n=1 Tax=Alsobacter metallidurans TaxID=340221 RepID=A0A917MGM0_9HYPH|nr:hypothetical protein GCM10007036_16230 [Alsobacter metallidurans]